MCVCAGSMDPDSYSSRDACLCTLRVASWEDPGAAGTPGLL